MFTNRLFRRAMSAACLCAVVLTITNPAPAQSGDGFVSEPFRSRDFNRDARRLRLDWAQRIEVEREHERYKQAYAALDEGALNALMKRLADAHSVRTSMPTRDEVTEMRRGTLAIPTAKDVEDVFRLRQTVIGRVMELERQLFDAMETHLRSDQRNALAQLRYARERAIYDRGFAHDPLHHDAVNLVSIIDGLDLTDEDWNAVEESVIEYQVSSNRSIKAAHDKTIDSFVSLLEALEEAREANGTADRSRRMQLEAAIDVAMQSINEDAAFAERSVRSITARSVEAIALHLPAEKEDAFRLAYRQRAYPEIFGDDPESPRRMFDMLEQLAEEIPADVQQSIRDLKRAWTASHDALSAIMIAAADTEREASAGPFVRPAADNDSEVRIEETRVQRSAVNARTCDSIISLLADDDLRAQVEQMRGPELNLGRIRQVLTMTLEGEGFVFEGGRLNLEVVGGGGAGEFVLQISGNSLIVSGHPFGRAHTLLPGPIEPHEFRWYADRLGLSPDSRLIAEGFLEEYRASYETAAMEQAMPMIESAQQSADDQSAAEVASAVSEARRRAFSILVGVDKLFFDDLTTLLSDDELARLPEIMLARDCVTHDVSGAAGGWPIQSNPVNLPHQLSSIGLSMSQVAALAPLLSEYDSTRFSILKEQRETLLRRDVAQAEAQGPEAAPDVLRARETARRIDESLERLSKQRNQIDHEFAARFVEAVPAAIGRDLANRVKAEAHPQVWPDRENAEPVVDAALSLADLSNQQQTRLVLISVEHTEQHETLCREMMALEDERVRDPNLLGSDPDDMNEWRLEEQRMAALHDQREEWNETTRRRIRATLTEEQAKLVEGLDPQREGGEVQWIGPVEFTFGPGSG